MDLSESRDSIFERRHPWEIARARHFVDVALPLLAGGGGRVLDVGAGDAFVSRMLVQRAQQAPQARALQVTAWDVEYTDDDMRELAAPNITLTREPPAPAPGSEQAFDLALLLDVLEHVPDDRAVLRDIVRRVKPGGAIVVSVPAWPSLFSLHDMKLRHLRRYTPEGARALVETEGLRIDRCGGLFHSLLPVRAVATKIEGKTGRMKTSGVTLWRGSRFVTRAVNAALRADTIVSRVLARMHVDAPGLSWWCVVRI